MKLRYWIAIALAAIVAIVVAGAAVLLETEAGLRWTVNLVEKHSDGAIRIGAAHGKLAGPFTLDDLRVTLPTAVIEVHHLEGDWHPTALVAGKLRIAWLHGSGVRIATRADQTPSQGLPQQLKLPLHVIVTEARFTNLALESAGRKLQLNRLAFTLDASNDKLWLGKLEASGPRIVLAGQLQVQPHSDWPLHARLDTILRPPDYPEIGGRTRLDGALRGKLKLEQTLATPFKADLDATVEKLFDTPNVRGTLHIAQLDPHVIEPSWPALQAGADLNFDGGLHHFNTRGAITLAGTSTHTIKLDLTAGLTGQRAHIEHLNLALANTPARLSLHGSLNLNTPHKADLTLAWENLRWPLENTKPIATATAGGAHIRGGLDAWTLDAETLLQTTALPQGRWALKAQGNPQGIKISALAGRWFGGTISGKGKIALVGKRPFQFSARLRGLQAHAVSTRLQGHVGFDLDTSGELEPLQAQVKVSRLAGHLQGRPIKGKIAFTYADQAITIHDFTLAAGANRFDAEGRWGKHANLRWHLQAPKLAALGDGLGGQLNARGSVTGAVDAPHLKATVNGQQLRWGDLGIERLQAQADIDLAAHTAATLELHVSNLDRGRLEVRQLDAKLNGPSDAQHFSLALSGNAGDVKLAANGRLDSGRWVGKLTEASLSPAKGPQFTLRSPADLTFGSGRQALAKSCWDGPGDAQFCLAAASAAQGWKANFSLQDLPLALADPWLADGVTLDGMLNGTLAASGGGKDKLEMLAEIHAGHGSVTRSFGGNKQRFAFNEAGLEVRLDNNNARARLGFIFPGGGMLDATAEIPWRAHAEPAGKLQLVAHLRDLSGVGALSDAVSDVAGRLDADLEVNGSLKSPRFKGNVRLSNAALTLTRFGTRIQNGNIVLHGTGVGLRIEGKVADAHSGNLNIKGALAHEADQWMLNAHVQGKNFRALDMPEMQVTLSPDLQ
ncbi:MAG: hypothetical protein ACRER1_08640, partial [Gammaproteobacteria bacterium]